MIPEEREPAGHPASAYCLRSAIAGYGPRQNVITLRRVAGSATAAMASLIFSSG